MAEAEWIKLYLKTFRTSRKISAIERMKNGDTIIVIWLKLLCLAGEINDDGAVYITPQMPFDSVSLSDELRKPRAVVDTAIKVFQDLDMIIKDDAGFIQVINWETYQNVEGLEKIRKQTRERVARCRANKSNADVTHCNDIEEEGEEDTEFHSFNRSIAREEKERIQRELMYGELGGGVVMLSDAERDYLLDELSLDEFNYYVGVVRDCEKNGQKYKKKTHFQAILDMAKKDRKIKK
ncbi:MAG: phage replisome organizer N-terminal domain-containing protein [Bacteroidaceae bacterium]|nr:phage replisome organizer N-terminal domain-containing protein [Bacteroidaceae bacterium]